MFEGYLLDDECHVYGRIIYSEGEYYIGEWLKVNANGYGEYYFDN